ncbi:MAG: septal ring lytic transglycosylase RlpA family protein [Azoarcus sp.]|jgi:rare lipoprotein A|nr:septal ring lytic transglycosylase RlpA family protein [Azoarcus sp.]
MSARGGPRRHRLRLVVALALMLALLTACSSAPPRSSSHGKSAKATKAAKSTKAKKTAPVAPAPPAAAAPVAPPAPALNAKTPAPPGRDGGADDEDDGLAPDLLPNPLSDPRPDLQAVPDPAPRDEPLNAKANRPYRALGRRYEPRTRIEPFTERGVASWYGRRFHGHKTSSGERYNMYAMSAAHPTLPIPSYARVTNLANARSVVVRINDRGPFLHGRVMDLSYAAASRLDYISRGSAQVEIEQLLPAGAEPLPQAVAQTADDDPLTALLAAAVVEPSAVVQAADDDDPLAALLATAAGAEPPTAPEVPNMHSIVTNANTDKEGSEQNLFLQLGVFASRENAEEYRYHVTEQIAELAGRTELVEESGRFLLLAGPYDADSPGVAQAAERIGERLHIRPFAVWRTTP